MKSKKEKFTLEEVEQLVKNAYEVGVCDGNETKNTQQYRNSNHFWNSNKTNWINSEIKYVI